MKLPAVDTILRRCEPDGGPYDRVRVVGVFDAGENGIEVVVAPADDFAGPIAGAWPDIVQQDFEIESEPTGEPAEWATDLTGAEA